MWAGCAYDATMASSGGDAPLNSSGGWLRDLIRPPSRQFVIDTELSAAEVVERLRAIVEPGSVFLAGLRRTNKLFAGEVSPDGFKIMRLIYYANSSLPVLIGRFETGPSGARVQVTMRLMRFTQIFFRIWFGFLALFFATVALATVFSSRKNGVMGLLMLGAVAMGAFGYLLILAGPFGLEARKARGLLEEALQTTPGPRIQKILASAPPRLSRLAKYVLAIGGVAIAVSVLVSIVMPPLMVRSEPYHIAESFVRSDPVVQDELGAISGIEFERSGGYNLSYAGPEGSARFALRVEGTRGTGIVFVTMSRHLRVWQIRAANLREPSGRIVPLQAATAAEDCSQPVVYIDRLFRVLNG